MARKVIVHIPDDVSDRTVELLVERIDAITLGGVNIEVVNDNPKEKS